MFFKNNKIEFFCTLPQVKSIMPIIEAKKYIHEWKNRATKEFNEKKHELKNYPKTIARCPGINLIQSQGWIIRTWQDAIIETYNDEIKFNWTSAIDQQNFNSTDFISYHDHSRMIHFNNWPKETLKNIIKFNTGWKAKIPKGYILYQFPVFYSDENRFTTCSGAYIREYGIADLNVPVYWNSLNSKTLIEAGTPIAQLILVPQKEYDYEITEVDVNALTKTKILTTNKFIPNYKKIKDFWKNE